MVIELEFVRRCTIVRTCWITQGIGVVVKSAVNDGVSRTNQHWWCVVYNGDQLCAGLDIAACILGRPGADDQACAIATGQLYLVGITDRGIGGTIIDGASRTGGCRCGGIRTADRCVFGTGDHRVGIIDDKDLLYAGGDIATEVCGFPGTVEDTGTITAEKLGDVVGILDDDGVCRGTVVRCGGHTSNCW